MNNQEISKSNIETDAESLMEKLVKPSEVHINVSQDIIIITKDKIELCLSNHLKNMENKRSWIAPLSVFITILAVIATSTFRDFGLSADTWFAIFLIVGALSFLWFLHTYNKSRKAKNISDIIEELKKKSSTI